jgi:hypothetical protein
MLVYNNTFPSLLVMVVFPLVFFFSSRPLNFMGNALICNSKLRIITTTTATTRDYADKRKRRPHIDNSKRRFQARTLSLVSKDSTADCMNNSSISLSVWNAEDLEEYLNEMIKALPNGDEDIQFQLTLNEPHRVKMMRAILGMSKVEFKHEMRELQSKQQWKRADTFVRHDLQALMGTVDAERAPNFATAIQKYLERPPTPERPQQSCTKFFSTLARGRIYQGRMERVLQNFASPLLPKYQHIVNDLPDQDLLQLFVEDHKNRCADEDNTCLLQQCLDMKYVQVPSDSMDGGRAKGRRSEVDLYTYLTARYEHKSNYRVLAPVWIRSFSIHQNIINNKINKCPYVLHVPPECMQPGTTNEYDAMIVRTEKGDVDDSDTLTIHEVWDAKATLDVSAIYDILRKKVSSLESILDSKILTQAKFVIANDNSDSSLEVFQVQVGVPSQDTPTNTTIPPFPQIGLFTSCLPTPRAAARRLQLTVCEALLESDREFVLQVLEANTGKISPPRDIVQQHATRLLQLVQKVQPIVVVSKTINGVHK